MNPSVSVILPTHNRSALLARAVRSVLNQTYGYWELIIVDDNSTDGTATEIKPFLDDKRIRYIRLEPGRGGSAARNTGLDNAEGEFIAFLDDDDEWLPQKLEKQIEVFNQNKDAGIVACNFNIILPSGRIRKQVNRESFELSDMRHENASGSFSFCMIPRALIGGIRLDERLTIAQDWDFWLKILLGSSKKGYIYQDFLVNYYVHEAGRLTTKKSDSYISFLRFLRKYYPIMDTHQQKYNLAYLLYFRYFSMDNFTINKLRLVYKALYLLFVSGKLNFSQTILFLTPLLRHIFSMFSFESMGPLRL